MPQRFWLLKSDPETFGWEDLLASPGRRTVWDGVRNHQARNLLRDEISTGDEAFFYHSQTDPAVVGIVRVIRAGFPDPTEESGDGAPRWYAIEIEAGRALPRRVPLAELRRDPALQEMVLLHRSRLSVQPVRPEEWRRILALGGL